MSSIVNKVKGALHSDKSETHNTSRDTRGAPEGTHGPHSSRVANAADPREDSDRDRSRNTGRTAGYGEHSTTTGMSGTGMSGTGMSGTGMTSTGMAGTGMSGTGMSGTSYTSGTREGEQGPRSSRIANAMDPRVDSDRDASRTTGGYGSTTTGMTGTGMTGTGMTGTGMTGTSYTSGTREGEQGPHSSRIANAMDPRVDSDRDASRTTGGYGSTTTGTTGLGSSGYGTTGRHTGSGATPGQHKSDMMNKVDSDLDGSKTMGGNKTYQ